MRSHKNTSLDIPTGNNPVRSKLRQVLAIGFLAGIASCAHTGISEKALAEQEDRKACAAAANDTTGESEIDPTRCTDDERLKIERNSSQVCNAELDRLWQAYNNWSAGEDEPIPGPALEKCSDHRKGHYSELRASMINREKESKEAACDYELYRIKNAYNWRSVENLGSGFKLCSDDKKAEILAIREGKLKEWTCYNEKKRLMTNIDSKADKALQACSEQDQEIVLRKLPLRRAYAENSALVDAQEEKCSKALDRQSKTHSRFQVLKGHPVCRKYEKMKRNLYKRFELFTGKFDEERLMPLKSPIFEEPDY